MCTSKAQIDISNLKFNKVSYPLGFQHLLDETFSMLQGLMFIFLDLFTILFNVRIEKV